jgi:hypothetical protein
MSQMSVFGGTDDPPPKPAHDLPRLLRAIITVKAAPNPSEKYGETVCVAAFNADPTTPGWLRLYPINFRELGVRETFKKYDIVEVEAVPARQDPRQESWRPRMHTLRVVDHVSSWRQRASWLEPAVETSMCQLYRESTRPAGGKSLALVRPREVLGLDIKPHPGWTPEQQHKIDQYVLQERLFDERDRTPLQAPRFLAHYRYRCHEKLCNGHNQGLLDWEFVVLQRRLAHHSDAQAIAELRTKFFDMMCGSARRPAFYVGNQAKHPRIFSVLGVYYPQLRHSG